MFAICDAIIVPQPKWLSIQPLAATAMVFRYWIAEALTAKAKYRHPAFASLQSLMVNGRWVVWDSCSQTLDEGMISSALRSELAKPNLTERQEAAAADRLAPYLRRFYAEWDCM